MFLENRTAPTKYGFVKGVPAGNPGYTVFKGIPFASPPVGPLRWAAPREPESWSGVRPCSEFAPAAIQLPGVAGGSGFYQKEFYPAQVDESEDCLYLNIWTPTLDPAAKLPVMFWIHGGAYNHGYSYEMEFDGESFCKRGVVLVTVPYRLAALGFFAHPELSARDTVNKSGNYAVLDIIAALKWVRENISGFGGDPVCVPVFGQSAGGGMTQAICTSPVACGLFKGAIIHSAGDMASTLGKPLTLEEAQEAGLQMCRHLGVTLQQLEEMDGGKVNSLLLEAAAQVCGPLSFRPTVDGHILPQPPGDAFAQGMQHSISYMTGSVSGDSSLRLSSGSRPVMTVWPEIEVKNGRAPVHVYYFDRAMPGDGAGAFHSSELWYVFGTLSRCWRSVAPGFTAGDYALSDLMADYWTNFAYTGDPSSGPRSVPIWPPFTCQRHSIMHFNETLPGASTAEELLRL